MKNTNRRTFLKAVTAGAVAATLPPPSFADKPERSASNHATRHASSTSSLLDEVNILQGTDSAFSSPEAIPCLSLRCRSGWRTGHCKLWSRKAGSFTRTTDVYRASAAPINSVPGWATMAM
jgi:hypothetical protein